MTEVQGPDDAAPSVPRKKRRVIVWVIAASLTLGLLAAGIVFRISLSRSEPLTVVGSVGSERWIRTEHPFERTKYVASFTYGVETWFAFEVRNDGRWPVTITGIERTQSDEVALFRITGLRMWRCVLPGCDGGLAGYDESVPFKPVELRRGRGSVELFIIGRFGDCQFFQPGSTSFFSSVNLYGRVLGISRTFKLRLGFDLAAPSPPAKDCPTAEKLGAQHISSSIEGILGSLDLLQVCLTEPKKGCYAVAREGYSYAPVKPGDRVRLTPGPDGRVAQVEFAR